MKKITALLTVMFVIFCTLSACNDGSYDDGYADGYDAGYYAAAIRYRNENSRMSASEWKKEKEEAEAAKSTKPNYSALPEPASGTILSGTEYSSSEITVTADSGSSYVVSLKNSSGVERLSFFVRSGDTVTVGVPAEYLYVYFASGTVWYGYGEGLMFGEDTVYSKDDDILDFSNYTWEYTLYPVYDGNFSETPSDESEFFG